MATDWKEVCKGVTERRLSTNYCHLRIHYSADPEKDTEWVMRHSALYGGVKTPKWRREMEIDYTAVEGQPVYPMWADEVHVFDLPLEDMVVYRVIDHGIRHPTVCLWVGVYPNGDRHVFREYYRSDATIPLNCSEILRLSTEPVAGTYIDPAVRQRVPLSTSDNKPVSILSLYNEHLHVSCRAGDNSEAGYTAVRNGLMSTLARRAIMEGYVDQSTYFAKQYFMQFNLTERELLQMAEKPALSIARSCPRAAREMKNLRFKNVAGDQTVKAQPEEVMDFEDDGPDCVRYAMQSKLSWTALEPDCEPGSALWEIRQKRLDRSNPFYVKRA